MTPANGEHGAVPVCVDCGSVWPCRAIRPVVGDVRVADELTQEAEALGLYNEEGQP